MNDYVDGLTFTMESKTVIPGSNATAMHVGNSVRVSFLHSNTRQWSIMEFIRGKPTSDAAQHFDVATQKHYLSWNHTGTLRVYDLDGITFVREVLLEGEPEGVMFVTPTHLFIRPIYYHVNVFNPIDYSFVTQKRVKALAYLNGEPNLLVANDTFVFCTGSKTKSGRKRYLVRKYQINPWKHVDTFIINEPVHRLYIFDGLLFIGIGIGTYESAYVYSVYGELMGYFSIPRVDGHILNICSAGPGRLAACVSSSLHQTSLQIWRYT